MNYWIFQSKPEKFDLREKFVEGAEETWYATRYQNLMRTGDIVFFWLAGDNEIRGIYGWGRLTSSPYKKTDWDSHGVDVKFEKRITPFLPARKIKQVQSLRSLLIFINPAGTNFLLTREQAEEISQLIERAEQRPEVM